VGRRLTSTINEEGVGSWVSMSMSEEDEAAGAAAGAAAADADAVLRLLAASL
jgi:hypothetical protein